MGLAHACGHMADFGIHIWEARCFEARRAESGDGSAGGSGERCANSPSGVPKSNLVLF